MESIRGFASCFCLVLLFSCPTLLAQVPECTSLIMPSNGETDVSPSSDLHWAAVPNATAYSLFIGRSPGSWDVVDGTDVANSLSYTPPSGWNPNTTYYVMVLPRNNAGAQPICPQQQFTTGLGDGIPGCVTLKQPLDGAYGVPPATLLEWFPQNEATGYLLSVGTSSGNFDILDQEDVGDVTEYDLLTDLPTSQRIYIRITPYNAMGESPMCSEDGFRTRSNNAPLCTDIINPRDGDEFVSVTANITWIRDFGASGYRMTIEEKEVGGIRILDNEFVGTGTNFKPPDFKPNTTYFVTIVPFNDLGSAVNCAPISFTTGDAPDPPACTTLLRPVNGDTRVAPDTSLEWQAVTGANGYILTAGTSPGSADLLDRLDVGLSTTYNFDADLPEGRRIYIQLTPYSSWGAAENCTQESFTILGPDLVADDLPIPRFFTPNNDGFNDTWLVQSTPEVGISRVFIFNRFGRLLKQMGAEQAWDGNVNGRPVASDSYWFKIETIQGNVVTGYLLLKR